MAERCRKCGEPVRWAKTKNGNWAPFDVVAVDEGVRFVLTQDAPPRAYLTKTGKGHVNHFATCPHAEHFRTKPKKRGSKKPPPDDNQGNLDL